MNLNPDKNFEQFEHNFLIEKAFDEAKRVLKTGQINPDVFDNYDKGDKKFVARMEEKFKKTATPEQIMANKLSTILEAIVYEQTELSNWLGEDVFTIKTSRFDDITNGVDVIAEFVERKEEKVKSIRGHLGLAFDVTFSNEISDKLNRIKNEIDDGHLATVKYFVSESMSYKGEFVDIPRVIMSVDGKTVNDLAQLWLEEKKKLAFHPIQMQILEETLVQLKVFKEYAERTGHKRVIKRLNKALIIIQEIYDQKKNETSKLKEDDFEARDAAFESLLSNLKNIFGIEFR